MSYELEMDKDYLDYTTQDNKSLSGETIDLISYRVALEMQQYKENKWRV